MSHLFRRRGSIGVGNDPPRLHPALLPHPVGPHLDFPTSLRAEALGEPGKRTFRILANSEESSAIIGLEK